MSLDRPIIPARVVPSYTGAGLIPYRLAGRVDAGKTLRLERRLLTGGIIRHMSVRLYTGARLAVKVRVYLWRQSGEVEDLVKAIGKEFLDGDDDHWRFDLSHEVDGRAGWYIVMEAENTSAEHAYDVAATVEVDHSFRAHGGGY